VNYSKTIICLANSRKLSGRCVAGKEIANQKIGNWIRPVSKRSTGELSHRDRCFSDSKDPCLLDVVTIEMLKPQPDGFQTENDLIDDTYWWTRVRSATHSELRQALDHVDGDLWDNSSSSYNGRNDRIEEEQALVLASSLKLIEVSDLKIEALIEGAEFGNPRRKVRGEFTLNDVSYRLSVTDPTVESEYADGTHDIGRAILCISLGEPYEGYAYKLIAGVIRVPEPAQAEFERKDPPET
jgi:hypothetical protein